MSATFIALSASLRRAATRPRSAVRKIVAAVVFFLVATPVSAALCAASMPSISHDSAAYATRVDAHASQAPDNECCDTQVVVDLTAVPRSFDADATGASLHLLALAGPPDSARGFTPWAHAAGSDRIEPDPPPPGPAPRLLPRLLL